MRITTLRKDFSIYSDAVLIELARSVLSKMEYEQVAHKMPESIYVPNLEPSHSEMTDIVDAFENAVIALLNKGKAEKIIRDVRRAALTNALKLWAMQIEVFAKGDVEILVNSGFEISKQPMPTPHPGEPVGFTATCTAKGELTLTAKKIKGVAAFIFEVVEVDTTNVLLCTQGSNKCVHRNLKNTTYYDCRVAYVAKDDFRVFSPFIRCFVL